MIFLVKLTISEIVVIMVIVKEGVAVVLVVVSFNVLKVVSVAVVVFDILVPGVVPEFNVVVVEKVGAEFDEVAVILEVLVVIEVVVLVVFPENDVIVSGFEVMVVALLVILAVILVVNLTVVVVAVVLGSFCGGIFAVFCKVITEILTVWVIDMRGLVLVVKCCVLSAVVVVLCNVCSVGTNSKSSSDASLFAAL